LKNCDKVFHWQYVLTANVNTSKKSNVNVHTASHWANNAHTQPRNVAESV